MDLTDGGAGGAGGDSGAGDFGSADDLVGGTGGGEQGGAGAGGGAGGAGAAGGAGGEGTGGEGGAGGGEQGGQDPEFYSSLSSEVGEGESASNLDWVKSKGFKGLDDIVKSLRGAERRISEGGGIKVPGDDATAEDIAAFRTAIGVPEKPDGYTLPQPKDSEGNPIKLNEGLLSRVTEAGVKHGLPKGALEAVLNDLVTADIADHDAQVKALQEAAGEHVKGWGDQRQEKLLQVNSAAKDLGLTKADMEYLRGMPSGAGKSLDMLAKFGQNFSEDTLINGGKQTFGMTAEQAQAEIAAIKEDRDVLSKALVPGTAENTRYNRALEAVAAHAAAKK